MRQGSSNGIAEENGENIASCKITTMWSRDAHNAQTWLCKQYDDIAAVIIWPRSEMKRPRVVEGMPLAYRRKMPEPSVT